VGSVKGEIVRDGKRLLRQKFISLPAIDRGSEQWGLKRLAAIFSCAIVYSHADRSEPIGRPGKNRGLWKKSAPSRIMIHARTIVCWRDQSFAHVWCMLW